MSQQLFNIGLPKWPELRVVGTDIDSIKANVMTVRMEDWLNHSSNEEQVNGIVNAVFWKQELDVRHNYSIAVTEWCKKVLGPSFEAKNNRKNYTITNSVESAVQEFYGHVHGLEYLRPNLISSSWIGGPHAWYHLTGKLCNTHTYNIGKWPDVRSVFNEWQVIANTFKFLELRCQLFSGESCEDGTKPIVEFQIENGIASAMTPGPEITIRGDEADFMSLLLLNRQGLRETAFTRDSLEEAVTQTLDSLDRRQRYPDFEYLVLKAVEDYENEASTEDGFDDNAKNA